MTERTLSTTAQRTYWLGRYLERAGNTADQSASTLPAPSP